MGDPIKIPTFNIFAFTAKCFGIYKHKHTHRAHLILAGHLSRENVLTYTNSTVPLCVSPRVQLLFICISVCLSVSLYTYSATESQSHRMVICFFFSLEHFVSLFKAFKYVGCVLCEIKSTTEPYLYKHFFFILAQSNSFRSRK